MKRVAIGGFGLTKFNKDDISIESLMLSSVKSLFDNNPNLIQKDIEVVLTSTNDNSKYLSNIISELAGISPKISHSVESLCNSGANSVVSAFSYISSGLADVALVVGAEKFDNPGLVLECDISRGQYKHPVYWSSMFTRSHMRKYGTTMEDLAVVSAKNHKNALANPYAYFDKAYSVDEIMQSKNITEDIRVLDCSFPCNGSAAVLLVSEDIVKKFTDCPVWLTGIGQKTISAGFTKNDELTSMKSTRHAANAAYAMSKKEPKDIDVAEVHDAFSICEIIEIEDLSFTQKGDGNQFVKNMYETQDKKINPRGGLIGSGHPLGATGIAQVIEISQQLQNKAEKRQVNGAKVGLVQNMSAAATSSTVLIFES
ncbi:MAG TPA: thiolase family protein [Nitrosopumilaceae archaeon]|nr:thiolase family protein [Nitrosopumilaceae archaeon]